MTENEASPARRDGLLLALVLLGFAALWMLYPHHLRMSDPWAYSELAHAMGQGRFFEESVDNIFVHRLGATLPVALIYKLFGVSITTTNLWSLICALVSLIIIWLALPSRMARLVGVALCSTNAVFFQMSVSLYPDISAATFMTLSAFILAKREQSIDRRHGWIFPVLAVASMFVAFLSKLSAYWLLPVWLVVFVIDARARRGDLLNRFYVPAIVAGIVIGTLYLIYNAWAWGHPLARLLNVSGVAESALWSITRPDAQLTLFNRLTVDAVAFLLSHYGVVLLPALCAVFVVPKSMRVWSLLTIFSVLLFWFGTSSLTSYQPMPLVSRMLLPALPSACIVTGYMVAHARLPTLGGRLRMNVIAACALAAVSVFFFNGYIKGWKNVHWFENEAVSVIKRDLEANPQLQFLVVSMDSRSPQSMKFFFQYEYPENLRVLAAKDLVNLTRARVDAFDKIYLYQNFAMAFFLNKAYGDAVHDLSGFSPDARRLFDKGGIAVDVVKQ